MTCLVVGLCTERAFGISEGTEFETAGGFWDHVLYYNRGERWGSEESL